jgi:hypothetical protein
MPRHISIAVRYFQKVHPPRIYRKKKLIGALLVQQDGVSFAVGHLGEMQK